MGFGYPREARDGLIESDPATFFLLPQRDLRYQWVCAHLDRPTPRRWSWSPTPGGCTPQMLHDRPRWSPDRGCVERDGPGDWDPLPDLLHPACTSSTATLSPRPAGPVSLTCAPYLRAATADVGRGARGPDLALGAVVAAGSNCTAGKCTGYPRVSSRCISSN